jgi:hypothetical protein
MQALEKNTVAAGTRNVFFFDKVMFIFKPKDCRPLQNLRYKTGKSYQTGRSESRQMDGWAASIVVTGVTVGGKNGVFGPFRGLLGVKWGTFRVDRAGDH